MKIHTRMHELVIIILELVKQKPLYIPVYSYEYMVLLYDRFNLPDDIFEIIFATNQQKIVAKEFLKYLVKNKGKLSKAEMSFFATQLHEGKYESVLEDDPYKGKKVKMSYNKRQFYDRILTPMKSMGLIDYDLYQKVYKLSTKFSNDLIKIGLMWKSELRKRGVGV